MATEQTDASVAAAKRAQRTERVHAVAALLASYDNVWLVMADAPTRGHYLAVADAAMQAASSAKGVSL